MKVSQCATEALWEKKSVKSTTVFSIGIVISIIKALLSRNCCHISVRHSVENAEICTLTLAMVLLKKLLNSWFDEFFQWEE